MKSFRLKRRNHSKSRKLSGRKLSGRKLRRGGNGSSSSSQISLDNLFDELNKYESVNTEIKFDHRQNLPSPFYNIHIQEREDSKRAIITNFDTKDELYVEIMPYVPSIKDHVISDHIHQVDKVLKILNEDFKKDEAMVESLSFLPKRKLQDRLSKPGSTSTDLGLLPNELVRHTMPYLRSTHPSYHISTSPNQYADVQENAVQYASDNSSSTKKGGRRRMKSNRSRKTRRRK
jgi:hypothetical protein